MPEYEDRTHLLRDYEVVTEMGNRIWQAESYEHAREQHEDMFPEEPILTVIEVQKDV